MTEPDVSMAGVRGKIVAGNHRDRVGIDASTVVGVVGKVGAENMRNEFTKP
jgi:hypothetical protein